MDAWARINSLAAAQYGHVTLSQLHDAGLARSTIFATAVRQAWDKPHPAVFRLPGAWPSDLGRLAAAVLAVGPPVALGRWSAAWLYGLIRTAPAVVELVLPHARRVAAPEGTSLYRSRTLVRSDLTVVRGLPATNAVRTLCDLAAVTRLDALRAAIIDARQRRLVEVAAVMERASTMGTAKGLRQLRRLLWELDGERCDSVLEHRLRARLATVPGLPPPASAPVPVDVGGRVLHVDIGWPQCRVGIEADGFGGHSSRRSLEIDVRRHNALERAGWRILRASWPEAGAEFPGLVRDLTELLQAGSPGPTSGTPAPRSNGGVTPWRPGPTLDRPCG